MAAQNSKVPSKETVDFLYKGLAFFYPRTIFGEEKAKSLGYLKSWSGMQSSDFALFVTNITNTEDVDEAAKRVLSWKRAYDNQEYPDATIPENLDELVSSLEEKSEQKGSQAEKTRLAKQALLQSEIAKEKGEIQTETPVSKAEVTKETTPQSETATPQRPSEPSGGIVLEVIKKTDLNPIARGTLKIATLPFFLAAPRVASTPEGQVTASAQHLLFQQKITSNAFAGIRPKALSLGISPKEFDNLLKTIAEQERAYPGLYNRISSGFGIQEIVVRAGIPQAVAGQIFLTPSSQAGSLVVPRRGLLGNFLGRAGQQIFGGLFKGAASKAVKKGAVTKAATTIAKLEPHVRVAAWVATGLSAVVRFIKGKGDKGGLGGTVTTIILFAGGILLLPIAPVVGAVVLGTGSLTGAATLAGRAGGYGNLASKAGEVGRTLIAGGISAAAAGIGTPLIISLVSIPIVVALILFIINSGAYIVPPAGVEVLESNPYISVEKEAQPSGSFDNGDLPLEITYTITVTAKKGTLTNVSFNHSCEVSRESGKFDCPAPNPEETPQIISPVEPYVFTYTQTYSGSQYTDSLVSNTFSVTADAEEAKGTTANGVASIIIGNPPTGCFKVAGSWPSAERSTILSAISSLVTGHPAYATKVCAAYPEVNLYYDPPKVCGQWGCAPGGNTIYFNSGGLGNARNAIYILAHEAGHVLGYGNPDLYKAYISFPGTLSELPVCSYGGSSRAEGFAEAISQYVVNNPCLQGNPSNIEFVETRIFK